MTMIELIEVMYPALNGKIEVGKPFPCPLAMHLPCDDSLMVVADGADGQTWKCNGGCAGDDQKNATQFIVNAMGVSGVFAFGLWHRLCELESQEDRIYHLDEEFPHWYPRGVQS